LTAVTNEYQFGLLVLLASPFALADVRTVGILSAVVSGVK